MAEGESRAEAASFAAVPAFVRGLTFDALPPDVVAQAARCLVDLIGVAAAGSQTRLSSIARAHAATQMGSRDGQARILFDGRRAAISGAAFAGATTIDAVDAHDGHALTKGHAGVAVLPALLALIDAGVAPATDGRELLTCLVLGYEIATRVGIAQHLTVPDYHCSGSWNALGCAAIGARVMGFDAERTRHALGIAEYFGPRGPMLRVTDYPTMLKDGSGWGAHVGITAALLARADFTGAPAATVEGADVAAWWHDLGTRWRIREQYFKAYAVCRWAQPAIEAALELQHAHGFQPADIAALAIDSFREAVALGSQCVRPRTTEEAQYSITFPVAAALVFGRLGAAEIAAPALDDPRVLRLLPLFALTEDAEFAERFPAERWARARITLLDGRTLVSQPARARGNPENPIDDAALTAKYHTLADPVLGAKRAHRIKETVAALENETGVPTRLLDDLLSGISAS